MKAKTPKPTGRKRRLTGYALLTLVLLTAIAWTASAWWAVEYGTDRRGTRLWNGTLSCWSLDSLFESQSSWRVMAVVEGPNSITFNASRGLLDSPEPARKWTVTPLDNTWQQRWWFGLGDQDTPRYSLHSFGVYQRQTIYDGAGNDKTVSQSVALWPIAILFGAAGCLLLWLGGVASGRAAINLCPTCGYNLAGLALGAKCPECGKAVPT